MLCIDAHDHDAETTNNPFAKTKCEGRTNFFLRSHLAEQRCQTSTLRVIHIKFGKTRGIKHRIWLMNWLSDHYRKQQKKKRKNDDINWFTFLRNFSVTSTTLEFKAPKIDKRCYALMHMIMMQKQQKGC
jgi:hypothetical protein